MKTRTRSLLKVGGLLLLLATMVLVSSPAMADLPASTCTLDAGTNTRTCDLWAMPGSILLPDGTSATIWGFSDDAAGLAQLPGPPIVANQGETLRVILHNELPGETVSLVFPGQSGLQDYTVGVGQGATQEYQFVLDNPGTFLYEAGPTPNGGRQVAMGLYGGLVVRPAAAPGQAYADPATAFNFEELLVLSELDPALNNSADPNSFELYSFEPRYWLINGLAYPQTTAIGAEAGATVLLRYVNAGLETHGMSVLGLRQQIVASDGKPIHAYGVVAEKIVSGETMDALLTIPAATVQGTQFAVYDASLMMHNASQRLADGKLAFGGLLTFVDTITGTAGTLAGPVVTDVQVSPNPTTGADGVTLSADLTSDAGLTAVEYFTGSVGAPGTGVAMSFSGGGPAYAATASIPAGELATWQSGLVTLYLRGQDANGWGLVGSVVLNLDKTGPESNALSLSPEPSNGSRPVLLRATGDDHSNGANPVVAGQFSMDGGVAQPMQLARTDNPVTAMTATLSLETVQVLPQGLHPVSVTSQDSLGNWGAPGVITLTMDTTGPDVSALTLAPATLDLSGAPPVVNVRLEAMLDDPVSAGAQSMLANAEGFVETAGPNGTGFDLFASDAMFDESSEAIYFDIPVSAFLLLSQGPHTVYVHGLDAAGNWGPMASAEIYIERGATDTAGPVLSSPGAVPNPTAGATLVTLTVQAADPDLLSNIAGGQWSASPGYIGTFQAADGAFDSPLETLTAQIDVTGWPNGTRRISLVAYDTQANFGAPVEVALSIQGNNAVQIMADNFESGNLDAWTNVVGDVTVVPEAGLGAARAGLGMRAGIDGGAPAYASHAMPLGEAAYRARFLYDPNSANLGATEHDILAGLYADKAIMGIQVEASGNGGYEVRGWALSNGVPIYTGWHGISDEPHALGIHWGSASQASLALIVDGQVVEILDYLDTAAYTVHEIRLGPSGDIDPAASGAQYFDEYDARRAMTLFLPLVSRGQ